MAARKMNRNRISKELTREERKRVFAAELTGVAISAAYADDTWTEEAIHRVAFCAGLASDKDGYYWPDHAD